MAVVVVDVLEPLRESFSYKYNGRTTCNKRAVNRGISRLHSLITEVRKFDIPIFFVGTLLEGEPLPKLVGAADSGGVKVRKLLTSAFDSPNLPSFARILDFFPRAYPSSLEETARITHALYDKHRYPRLSDRLKENGANTLVVCGYATTCCVYATALDAVHLGYRVLTSNQLMFDATDHNAPDPKFVRFCMDFYRDKTSYHKTAAGVISAIREITQGGTKVR